MALSVGQAFPGGWSVTRADAHGVTVERARAVGRRETLRRLGLVLVPLVIAVALYGGTRDVQPGLRLVAWPVVGLLLLVVVLGVLSAVRAARQAALGLRLCVETRTGTVSGFAEARGGLADYAPHPVAAPLAEVAAVRVTVFRGAPPATPALAQLSVVLKDGTRLQGPELAVADVDWEAARDTLLPLRDAFAAAAGCPAETHTR